MTGPSPSLFVSSQSDSCAYLLAAFLLTSLRRDVNLKRGGNQSKKLIMDINIFIATCIS